MRRMSCAVFVLGAFLYGSRAFAHCDTVDGPVVMDAKKALESGDVTPVLKWVMKGDEAQIRDLFKKSLAVRKQGSDARELADRAFFESLVRIHRAGEGAPFTGLKPAGTEVEPGIALADTALETGDLAALEEKLRAAVERSLKTRFQRVTEAKPHAEESVEKGRAYVAAYVEFIHFVEELDARVRTERAQHAEEAAGHAHGH